MKRGLIFLIFIFILARLYYFVTDDFRLSNISYDLPYNPEWSSEPLTAAFIPILQQPFSYLGKGAQVYAFESQDKKYVLKFFKFKHIRPSLFIEWLPPIGPLEAFKKQKSEKKANKVRNIFRGYKIAYDRDRNYSGLLYIHLNKSSDINLQATLIDKIGLKHLVNLDDTVFILQKRGETFRSRLAKDLARGDLARAETHIHQILNMYLDEYANGVFDRDHGVMQNSGFIDEEPFHLDVGKFSSADSSQNIEFYEKDLIWVALKIKFWLQKNYPQHANALTDSLNAFLSQKFAHLIDLRSYSHLPKKSPPSR